MSETQEEINRRLLDTRHLADGLKGRTVRGGLVNMLAQIVSMVLQVGSLAILARLLTPADYGLLAMATTATVFAAIFTNLGLTTPTVQRSTITHEQVCTLFYINLAGGGVIFLLSCAAAPLFAFVFHDSRVITIIILLSLAIPLGAAGAQFNAILIRNMRWVTVQAINIGSQLMGIITAIILAWQFSFGVWALVAQQLVAAVLMLLLNFTLCAWRPSRHFDLSQVRSELAMGMDIALFSLFNYVHRQFDNIIIGSRWGAIELGIYSRAYNLLWQLNMVATGPATSAVVPSLSRLAEDRARWKRHFMFTATAVAAGAGALFAVVFGTSTEVVALLFGNKWAAVTPMLNWLLVAGMVTAVHGPFSWNFVTFGRTRLQFYWSLFTAPVLFVAYWIGAYWGGLGVAMAYAIVMITINPIYLLMSVRCASVTLREGFSIILPAYLAFVATVLVKPQLSGIHVYGIFGTIIVKFLIYSIVIAAIYLLSSFILESYKDLRRLIISEVRNFLVR
ncbi:MAG TPA: lipopolysaccharide biosynthesis protein [Sphingobium sp.]|nr:lipopolysaccharide biosynthesis protein [Sphingobium sp.]